jgi:hypothetical protein
MPEEIVNETATQSEEVTSTEQVEATPETTPPIEQETERKGITVKYNKEDTFIDEDKIPEYARKGLNYDKVETRAKEYETHLERTAKFNGFDSTDEYLKALDEAEQERNIKQEAEKAGMDEETYRQYLQPVNEKLKTYEQKIQQLETADMNRQIQSELTQLKTDKDFAKYEEATINAWKSNPAFENLTDAYEFVSYKDKLAQTRETTEQETIRKLQQNGQSSTGSLGEGADTPKLSVKDMSKAEFEDMILRSKRGEKINF